MDQINIIDEKLLNRTQVNVRMTCESHSVDTSINRFFVNEILDSTHEDNILSSIVKDMMRVFHESPHVAGCKSCTARVGPLMSMVSMAIEGDSGCYTYCAMEDVFPAFTRDEATGPIASLNIKRYEVWIRHFSLNAEPASTPDGLSSLADKLPGVLAMVRYPCAEDCWIGKKDNDARGGASVRNVVIHLNDDHEWSREAIADWLDSVDEPENGVDLAFKVPEKEEV